MTVSNLFRAEAASNEDKVGKPKSSTAPFSMRLTVAEREFLDAHCGDGPWAAYIRECVFGDKAQKRRKSRRPQFSDEKLALVLAELGRSRLSSNVNQLAKSANTGTLDVSGDVEEQLRDACDAIIAMRGALMTALGLHG